MDERITIGQLAKLTGISPKTIRYYEEVGILPPPQRDKSRYRLYSETDVRRLQLVKRAKLLDVSLNEVRELVEWASSANCHDFQDRFQEAVRGKLEEVDKRMAELSHLKQDLQRMEAHFMASTQEMSADHTMLECSPDTCTCLGSSSTDRIQIQEVKLWTDRSKPER